MVKQGECEKCTDRGETHGQNCIVRKLIFKKNTNIARSTRAEAMEAAVFALGNCLNRGNKTLTMSCEIIPFVKNQTRGRKMKSLQVSQEAQQKQISTESIDVNQIMEKVLIAGDLSKMEPKDRINYYLRTCESLGMNPMTKPFDLITLNGKMVLYPNRSGTDQLRKIGNVDTNIVSKEFDKETGCYVVVARAKLPSGRCDEDMGIVYCAGLKGDQLANAQLKAMTKAKRRVTLSIMGLGWIDESEVSSIKNAKTHKMDLETGSVIDVTEAKEISPVISPSIPGDFNSPDEGNHPAPAFRPSAAQISRLFAIAKSKGMTSKAEVKDWIANTFDYAEPFSLTELTPQEYQDICNQMEKITCTEERHPEPVEVIKLIGDDPEKESEPLAEKVDPLQNVPWAKYRDPSVGMAQ